MSFSIDFVASVVIYPFDDLRTPAKEGFLEMDGEREYFLSSLHEWGVDDYRSQWRDALVKLIGGMDAVGLVTSFASPESSSYFSWWILYRHKDSVYIQSQVLFYEKIPGVFSLSKLHSYIPSRLSDDPSDGLASEWVVSILDVQDFLNGTQGRGQV